MKFCLSESFPYLPCHFLGGLVGNSLLFTCHHNIKNCLKVFAIFFHTLLVTIDKLGCDADSDLACFYITYILAENSWDEHPACKATLSFALFQDLNPDFI